jgi:hypothetical protein
LLEKQPSSFFLKSLPPASVSRREDPSDGEVRNAVRGAGDEREPVFLLSNTVLEFFFSF